MHGPGGKQNVQSDAASQERKKGGLSPEAGEVLGEPTAAARIHTRVIGRHRARAADSPPSPGTRPGARVWEDSESNSEGCVARASHSADAGKTSADAGWSCTTSGVTARAGRILWCCAACHRPLSQQAIPSKTVFFWQKKIKKNHFVRGKALLIFRLDKDGSLSAAGCGGGSGGCDGCRDCRDPPGVGRAD